MASVLHQDSPKKLKPRFLLLEEPIFFIQSNSDGQLTFAITTMKENVLLRANRETDAKERGKIPHSEQ